MKEKNEYTITLEETTTTLFRTWFPEGFKYSSNHPRTASHKRGHDGQEMAGWGGGPKHLSQSQYDLDSAAYHIDGWSDDDPSERPAKRQNRRGDSSSGQTMLTELDENDQRSWSAHHLSAADMKNSPDILGALTPPQAEVRMSEMKEDLTFRN